VDIDAAGELLEAHEYELFVGGYSSTAKGIPLVPSPSDPGKLIGTDVPTTTVAKILEIRAYGIADDIWGPNATDHPFGSGTKVLRAIGVSDAIKIEAGKTNTVTTPIEMYSTPCCPMLFGTAE
jgi:hypothetical protein